MSFAVTGLTHCYDCGTALGMNEYGYCASCQEKRDEQRKKEKIKQEKETLKAEILGEVKEVFNKNILNEIAKMKGTVNEIDISVNKPDNINWDRWYADIGQQIISESLKGNDCVLINFTKDNNNKNIGGENK